MGFGTCGLGDNVDFGTCGLGELWTRTRVDSVISRFSERTCQQYLTGHSIHGLA